MKKVALISPSGPLLEIVPLLELPELSAVSLVRLERLLLVPLLAFVRAFCVCHFEVHGWHSQVFRHAQRGGVLYTETAVALDYDTFTSSGLLHRF